MIWSAAKALYRSMLRHPLFAALDLVGLSFGIAVFVTISLFVRFETSYDQWITGSHDIYEVTTRRIVPVPDAQPRFSTFAELYGILRAETPQTAMVRVVPDYFNLRRSNRFGSDLIEEEGVLVDGDFFRVFDLPFIAGDPGRALQPDTIILSESMARKYFGRADVVGQRLTIMDDTVSLSTKHNIGPPSATYTVSTVIRDTPANATLHFGFIRLLDTAPMKGDAGWRGWQQGFVRLFLRLDKPGQAAQLDQRLDRLLDANAKSAFWEAYYPDRVPHELVRLRLQRLESEHLAGKGTMPPLVALGAVGALALLIALINHVNLATARAGTRARDVVVRKVHGADAAQLRLQFVIEGVMTAVMACIVGLSVVELSLPLINRLGGLALKLDYGHDAGWLALVVTSVLAAGGLAGLYPAILLTGFQPVAVLASVGAARPTRLGGGVRQGLVFVQFAVVVAFFIVMQGFMAQVRHMATSDLGFSRHNWLATTSTIALRLTSDRVAAILEKWRGVPGVVSVSTGSVPGPYLIFNLLPAKEPQPRHSLVPFKAVYSDLDYFKTFSTPILAGRPLNSSDYADEIWLATMPTGGSIRVVINETAVSDLGFASPEAALGQSISFNTVRFDIVGVAADQRLAAPTEKIGPALYIACDIFKGTQTTIIRYAGVTDAVIKARLTATWRDSLPDLPLSFSTAEEYLDVYYRADRRTALLFMAGAVAAGIIGAVGLFGLAAFGTSARFVEIALRKTMGATSGQVARLLVLQFIRPVLLANLIAWPVAWLVLSRWLSQFDDRIALTPWYFLAGSGVSLLIAVMTVGGLALAAAGVSPGKALRHE